MKRANPGTPPALGFGAEAGSEIPITDPATGARTLLRDSSGDIVRTRLDGDTLREMALLTDGVYVPAGLGALVRLRSCSRREGMVCSVRARSSWVAGPRLFSITSSW